MAKVPNPTPPSDHGPDTTAALIAARAEALRPAHEALVTAQAGAMAARVASIAAEADANVRAETEAAYDAAMADAWAAWVEASRKDHDDWAAMDAEADAAMDAEADAAMADAVDAAMAAEKLATEARGAVSHLADFQKISDLMIAAATSHIRSLELQTSDPGGAEQERSEVEYERCVAELCGLDRYLVISSLVEFGAKCIGQWSLETAGDPYSILREAALGRKT